jgi:hypothetical protein
MDKTPLIEVKLTAPELMLLDGKTRPEVQALIEQAKRQIEMESAGADPRIAALVSEAVKEAIEKKKLVFEGASIIYCRLCERSDGYHTYARSGRKGGIYRRRGEPDRSNPIAFGAVELRASCVSIRNHVSVGCCDRCWEKAAPLLRTALQGVVADMPEALTGRPNRWRRVDVVKCSKCQWTGPETDLRPEPTLMGDGYYPGGCQGCDAKNSLFSQVVKRTGESTLIDILALRRGMLREAQERVKSDDPSSWKLSELCARAQIQLGKTPSVLARLQGIWSRDSDKIAGLRAALDAEIQKAA